MADWSKLSTDVLGLIHDKLSIPDCIRLKAACKSWNLAFKFKHHCPPKLESPWLMLPDHNDTVAWFFSIVDKKIYKVPCPEPMIRRRICIGSCHGWLIIVDDNCNMHLLNPLTGVQIPLPSVTTLPFVKIVRDSQERINKFMIGEQQTNGDVVYMAYSVWRMRRFFFHKAVLSMAPDADGNFTVVMIYSVWKRLAFARAGDEAWTSIQTPHGFHDVIHCNDKFYTASHGGTVMAWEPNGLAIVSMIVSSDIDEAYIGCMMYLVESPDGNLMLIARHAGEDPIISHTSLFLVFALDEQDLRWKKVKSLHQQTLFLGSNQSMFLSAVDFPDLKHNCIYFTNNILEFCAYFQYADNDIGTFNMESKKIEPIDHVGRHLNWPPSVWFFPSLS
ncbi:unnamed protein product [Musa hybrid cultivar]